MLVTTRQTEANSRNGSARPKGQAPGSGGRVGRSALARVGALGEGVRVRMEVLPVGDLTVDVRNRPPSQAAVARIAKAWDDGKCQPLAVSEKSDGALTVVCGQHRLLAARAAGVKRVPAVIYTGLTTEGEAKLFLAEDTRTNVTPYDRFVRRQDAGEATALEIGAVLADHGVALVRVGGTGGPNRCHAVGAIERLHNAGLLADVLAVLRSAARGDAIPSSLLTNMVLGGLGALLKACPDADHDRLALVVRRAGAEEIARRASAVRAAGTARGAAAWAAAIAGLYNHGLRTSTRLTIMGA